MLALNRRTLAPLEPAAGQPEPGSDENRSAIGLAAFPPPKSVFDNMDREQMSAGSVSPAPVARVLYPIVSTTKLRLRSFHHREAGSFSNQPPLTFRFRAGPVSHCAARNAATWRQIKTFNLLLRAL